MATTKGEKKIKKECFAQEREETKKRVKVNNAEEQSLNVWDHEGCAVECATSIHP